MAYQYQTSYPGFQTGFQQGYQLQGFQQNPLIYQPPGQPQVQSQVQNTGILYVEGDKGADEFSMLPNTFAFLKSTDGKAVYFKQALANGSITCEKFVKSRMPQATQGDFITRAEFEQFVRSMTTNKEETQDDE